MKKLRNHTILLLCISTIVFVCLLTCLLVFAQPIRVVGNSMMPSYQHNNMVFVNVVADNYTTSDVVIIQYGKEKIIKRIYAEAGDTVEIKAEGIYINQVYITDNSDEYQETKYFLGENEYFVLGDNYAQSTDSRYFGIICKSEIVGKVIKFS